MTQRSANACLLVLLLALTTSPRASAQEPLSDLSLEELMQIDAGRVFGASDRNQPVTEAPASVSFITGEEITRLGYRTLADILRGVRGLYVTDDRNFSLLGVRGFAKPGDYNSRILLLVNGHRVNDNVFGQAEIGAEFGLDPAMFERVEIVRGPASSLYGDSAFFAVVNVVTRAAASLAGGSVVAETGTLDTHLLRGSVGRQFANGLDAAASATIEGSGGIDKLYFPAFDAPETNHGVAEGLDGERIGQFYAQATFKALTFTGAYGSRRRDVPTASFGALFNAQDTRERTTDRHTLADLEYVRTLGKAKLTLRGSFDRFTYDGTFPFADVDAPPSVWLNGVVGTRWTASGKMTRALPGRQVLTVGAELIDNTSQDQQVRIMPAGELLFRTERASVQEAIFLQDELRFGRWVILNLGARYDRYETFHRVTPRAGLIVLPSAAQSFKYLYGRAFRAPNLYELNPFYFGDSVDDLRPESIDTHELVWERYTNDWLRTSVSTYWYKASRLITSIADPSSTLQTTFVNAGEVQARGLELEAQMRLGRGFEGVMSYALQRTKDMGTDLSLANSPARIGKLRVSIPGPMRRSFVTTELQYGSSRQTILGETVDAAVITNVTATAPLARRLELFAGVRNLFDVTYFDPASAAHRQASIAQNGRTWRVGLRWSVRPGK